MIFDGQMESQRLARAKRHAELSIIYHTDAKVKKAADEIHAQAAQPISDDAIEQAIERLTGTEIV